MVQLPSLAVLYEQLSYNPATGSLQWINNGREAGRLNVTVNGVQYRTSRIIFKMLYDEEPEMVDHRDGDWMNNRKNNLRAATPLQNAQNAARTTGVSGHRGVMPCKISGRWYAYIHHNKRRIGLGHYDNIAAAIEARLIAEEAYYGEFALSARGTGIGAT